MTYQMEISSWDHLYNKGWKNLICDEAFTHPAKYARGLIEHIYNHCVAEDWLHDGELVIDPFGGVGLGGLDAMRLGAHWVGVELEEKFVRLGNANIALWNSRYAGRFAKWGTAQIVQGDSRRLLDVVREAGVIVSSPPFGDGSPHNGGDAEFITDKKLFGDYGSTPGNLGNLRADERGFAAAVSSPVYPAVELNDS